MGSTRCVKVLTGLAGCSAELIFQQECGSTYLEHLEELTFQNISVHGLIRKQRVQNLDEIVGHLAVPGDLSSMVRAGPITN